MRRISIKKLESTKRMENAFKRNDFAFWVNGVVIRWYKGDTSIKGRALRRSMATYQRCNGEFKRPQVAFGNKYKVVFL
jgi:hypothetical protein